MNENPYRQTRPWKILVLLVAVETLVMWAFIGAIPRLMSAHTVSSLVIAAGFGGWATSSLHFSLSWVRASMREDRRFRREQRGQAIQLCDEFDAHATIVPLGDGFGVRVLAADKPEAVVYTIDEARQKLRELRHLNVANSAEGAE